MSRQKKNEGANKPRDAVYVRLKGPLKQWLENERDMRGGEKNGVKMPPIVREKLLKQLEAEQRKK